MVPDIVIHALASAAYAVLAWHFWYTRWRGERDAGAGAGAGTAGWERAALLAPLALHGAALWGALFVAPQLRFGFALALSLTLWLALLILWFENLYLRIEAFFPVLLLAAAVCAPLPEAFPGRAVAHTDSVEFVLHVALGIAAYSLFAVAALHALVIALVDRRLHAGGERAGGAGALSGPFGSLPPLMTLERTAFWQVGAAFAVLTLTFAIGIGYSESLLGRALRFDHKTVFLALSWATFGLLLLGRWLRGWRGRTAVRWTLSGFALLLLAYVGSRFVLEVILGRA